MDFDRFLSKGIYRLIKPQTTCSKNLKFEVKACFSFFINVEDLYKIQITPQLDFKTALR